MGRKCNAPAAVLVYRRLARPTVPYPEHMLVLSDDLRHFLTALLLVVGGLLPIVNPVGSAPMFLAMTHGASAETRTILALKIAINAFLLIMGSLIFGAYVLKVFGLSVA